MTKREKIYQKINDNNIKIAKIENDNVDLIRQSYLLTDSKQQYKQEMETRTISKRPKVTEEILVGRIYFKQEFTDEDTGNVIYVERSKAVMINGEWI